LWASAMKILARPGVGERSDLRKVFSLFDDVVWLSPKPTVRSHVIMRYYVATATAT
jgi:hypothetical protein